MHIFWNSGSQTSVYIRMKYMDQSWRTTLKFQVFNPFLRDCDSVGLGIEIFIKWLMWFCCMVNGSHFEKYHCEGVYFFLGIITQILVAAFKILPLLKVAMACSLTSPGCNELNKLEIKRYQGFCLFCFIFTQNRTLLKYSKLFWFLGLCYV